MMSSVYVKPREGGKVRQPERGGRAMSDTGAHVERDAYYERLILSGDVVECEPPSRAAGVAGPAAPVADNAARQPSAAQTLTSENLAPASKARASNKD